MQLRALHASVLRSQQQQQQQQQQKQHQHEPKPAASSSASSQPQPEEQSDKSETTASGEQEQKAEGQEGGREGEQDGKTSDGKDGKEEKADDIPPPPPHGDKTPWQVFLETMQSEFKQSKEWNDSTKALAEGAHQFTESESVQRARKAYEATSGAVSSTAANVLKTTATAVGKGAAWTWETPVMKGVRKGANATGDVLDKATKPIRETEAYKNVKDVIDDGSSSRYGGWADKEERRQRRLKWQKAQGVDGSPEVMEENPECVPLLLCLL